MKKLTEFFRNKDKRALNNIAVILALGVCLLLMSNTLFKPKTPTADKAVVQEEKTLFQEEATSRDSFEAGLEKRLEEALSQVEGAGKVKVLLTISYGREIVVAENSTVDETDTKETDKDGGSREISSKKTDSKKIMLSEGGGEEPLILKEIAPRIEGVILVAQGGDNVVLKDALIKATATVLGIESHKVQVLKMK